MIDDDYQKIGYSQTWIVIVSSILYIDYHLNITLIIGITDKIFLYFNFIGFSQILNYLILSILMSKICFLILNKLIKPHLVFSEPQSPIPNPNPQSQNFLNLLWKRWSTRLKYERKINCLILSILMSKIGKLILHKLTKPYLELSDL